MAQSSSSTAIQHRGPGIKLYLVIAAALLVLTVITVLVSFVNLGGFNVVIALGIASIKAMLVALFFMHLYYDDKVNMVIFFAALAFLTIFMILTMFDTQTRGQVNPETKSPINKEAVMYQQSTPTPETGTGH